MASTAHAEEVFRQQLGASIADGTADRAYEGDWPQNYVPQCVGDELLAIEDFAARSVRVDVKGDGSCFLWSVFACLGIRGNDALVRQHRSARLQQIQFLGSLVSVGSENTLARAYSSASVKAALLLECSHDADGVIQVLQEMRLWTQHGHYAEIPFVLAWAEQYQVCTFVTNCRKADVPWKRNVSMCGIMWIRRDADCGCDAATLAISISASDW